MMDVDPGSGEDDVLHRFAPGISGNLGIDPFGLSDAVDS